MQGYLTMIKEAIDEVQVGDSPKASDTCPFTHMFLQAGVGSMAAAVQAYLVNRYGKFSPTVIIVEAEDADCFFESAKYQDGVARQTKGLLNTVMVGLACGIPSSVAWDILAKHSDAFLKCPDKLTKRGMKLASNPYGNDLRFVSGESGAVGLGLVEEIFLDERIKNTLSLNENSSILLFSTEGATAPSLYNKLLTESCCE